MRILCRLGALLAPVFLIACSGLVPQPDPLDIYRLPTGAAVAPDAGASDLPDLALRIDLPQAGGILAGRRIAVMPADHRVSIYAGARWGQPVPELLRDRLIDAFRASGHLQAAFNGNSGLPADYILSSTLDDFQAEYHGGDTPTIVVTLNAMLIHAVDSKVIDTRRFHVEVATADSAVPAVVTTFGEAGDQLAGAVMQWVYAHLAAADAAARGNGRTP